LPLQSGPMLVRFRQAEHRLQLSLVETHRDGDTVRHEHVANLGAVTALPSVADRAAFWEQLIRRLAALGERVDYAAIIAAVAARVPPVTDSERHAIPPSNVKPDATAAAECAGVLGIDPSFGGALALYRGPGDWVVIDASTMGTGKQRELDGATFAAWLREHRPVKAFIEHAAARPGQDVSSMFRYGGMSWGLKAALAAFAVPCVEVTAATWRRAAGIAPGSDKERSRQMALQRWPDQAKYLGRKRDHGRAEAMLIAAYGAGTLKHGAGHESAEADTAADAAH
jgi:crossover junction endodeoxyribonuclease RuvC